MPTKQPGGGRKGSLGCAGQDGDLPLGPKRSFGELWFASCGVLRFEDGVFEAKQGGGAGAYLHGCLQDSCCGELALLLYAADSGWC